MSQLKLKTMIEEKEMSSCVHLLCKLHKGSLNTYTLIHTVWQSSVQTPCENLVVGQEGVRGPQTGNKGIPPVLFCRPSRVLQQHIRLLPFREQPIAPHWVCSVVHRTALCLIRREGCGIKRQSPPSQLHTAVHQLRRRNNRLLSWRRAHPLLPVPARHRRHWLAEAAPVLHRTRGQVSAFMWGAGRTLCVWVCVNRTVNAADFLVCWV